MLLVNTNIGFPQKDRNTRIEKYIYIKSSILRNDLNPPDPNSEVLTIRPLIHV